MGSQTTVHTNHIGTTIANVAEELGNNQFTNAAIDGAFGLALNTNPDSSLTLAEIDISTDTDDFSINTGAGVRASYNPFENELSGSVIIHTNIDVPYDGGTATFGASGGYDTQDGIKTELYTGYTKHDPDQRVHTWTVDSYLSRTTSGELKSALRGEAQMEIYKDSEGKLTSLYGQAALGSHTTYDTGVSAEFGLQRNIEIPIFGEVQARGGVGYNTTGTNFTERVDINAADLDINSGSDNAGMYGRIGLSLKF